MPKFKGELTLRAVIINELVEQLGEDDSIEKSHKDAQDPNSFLIDVNPLVDESKDASESRKDKESFKQARLYDI